MNAAVNSDQLLWSTPNIFIVIVVLYCLLPLPSWLSPVFGIVHSAQVLFRRELSRPTTLSDMVENDDRRFIQTSVGNCLKI